MLCLAKKWSGDDDSAYDSDEQRERYAQLREETGIPEEIGYRSKHTVATDLIETAHTAFDHACVVADSEFGKRGPFRKRLRELGEAYVAEVDTSKLAVVPEETDLLEPGPTPGRGPARKYPAVPDDVDRETVEDIAARVEQTESWEPVEWNEGSKGTLSGLFYRERVRVVTNRQTGWVEDATGWLLFFEEQPADGEENLKACLCWGVDDALLNRLVSWAHVRWTVE